MKKMFILGVIVLFTSCAKVVTVTKAPNLAVNKGNITVKLKNGQTKDITDANLKDVPGKVKTDGTTYKLSGKKLRK